MSLTKTFLTQLAKSKGLTVKYSGNNKSLFVSGTKSEEFVKRFTPDKSGNVRDLKGHFVKGGIPFKVVQS